MSPKVKKYATYYLVAGAAYAAFRAYQDPAARAPVAFAKTVVLWPAVLAGY